MECRREYFQGAHRFFLKAGGEGEGGGEGKDGKGVECQSAH